MSHFLAPKALENPAVVWVIAMEDGHFYCSPSSGWEWDNSPNNPRCFDQRGLDWSMAGAYRDWVNEVILAVQFFLYFTNLQPLFTEVQLSFNDYQLLHDFHDPPLGLPH